ncbi:hypothetical protein BC939DRAFT_451921, partial [Gamsiella multidivaricata]|uniref:uncharacterized protein n=1 Tax=Gamsiella multidivaricata TaxID=101098 RepID=UPI00221E50B1
MILIYYTTESICIGRSNWESPPRSTGVRCGYGWPFIFLHLPLAAKHGDCVQVLLLRDVRRQQVRVFDQPRSQALVQGAVTGSRRFRDESWFKAPSRLPASHRLHQDRGSPHQDRGPPHQHLYENCAHLVLYRILGTIAKEGEATEDKAGRR